MLPIMKSLFDKLFNKDNKPKPPDLENKSLTRSQLMRDALTYSESMLSKRFRPDKAQRATFEACCGNILAMTEELRKHNLTMAKELGIKPGDAVYDFVETNLDAFFIDPETNTYIDQIAYRDFHSEAVIFCQRVHESSIAEFGRLEHNYRTLRPVIHSVTQICTAIGKAVG